MDGIEGFARYAVFWAPPAESALARFGAAWFGWDAETGLDVRRPAVTLPRPLPEMTRAPWRYGLHGTLKPPFRLAPGTTVAELDSALARLAAGTAPLAAPDLVASTDMGFLALVPAGPTPALDALAAGCVQGLDRFRAPAGAAELARRRAPGLSPEQEANLLRWGYPYVMGAFRFHLTLSGRLRPGEPEAVLAAVTPLVAPVLGPGPEIADIALFGDPGANAGFRVLRRYSLTARGGSPVHYGGSNTASVLSSRE